MDGQSGLLWSGIDKRHFDDRDADFALDRQFTFACSHNLVHRLGDSGVVVSFATLSTDVCVDVLNQDIAAFPVPHSVDSLRGHLAATEVTIVTAQARPDRFPREFLCQGICPFTSVLVAQSACRNLSDLEDESFDLCNVHRELRSNDK